MSTTKPSRRPLPDPKPNRAASPVEAPERDPDWPPPMGRVVGFARDPDPIPKEKPCTSTE